MILNGCNNQISIRTPFNKIPNGIGNSVNGQSIGNDFGMGNLGMFNTFNGGCFNININNSHNIPNNNQHRSNNMNNFGANISNILNMVGINMDDMNSNGNMNSMNSNNAYEDDDEEYESENGNDVSNDAQFEGDDEDLERERELIRIREDIILNLNEFQFKHANKYIEKIEDTCAICLEKFKRTDIVKEFKCEKHVFHKDCLKKWLKKSNKCPLCKFDIMEEHLLEGEQFILGDYD